VTCFNYRRVFGWVNKYGKLAKAKGQMTARDAENFESLANQVFGGAVLGAC